MPTFRFLIDKEANFVYWAQSLIKWTWYFEPSVQEYFLQEAGELSEEEKRALLNFVKILKKEGNQFHFLWGLYQGKPIISGEEKLYKDIRKILNEKFEKIWQKEYAGLVKWKDFLQNQDFNRFEEDFRRIADFFNYTESNRRSEILIKLLISKKSDFPSAHVQPSFGDLMILNVSSVPLVEFGRVIGVIIHEFIHLLVYETDYFEILAKDSYKKLIVPHNLVLKNDYKWKHLFLESVITSIASFRFNNYMGPKLEPTEEQLARDNDFNVKKPLKEQSYGFLIRLVAFKLNSLTADHLNGLKRVDSDFTDKIGKAWLSVLN